MLYDTRRYASDLVFFISALDIQLKDLCLPMKTHFVDNQRDLHN